MNNLLIKLIEKKIKTAISNVNTTTVGEIVEYDPITMRADVQLSEIPVFNNIEYEPQIVPNCIVSLTKVGDFYVRPPYKVGDKVVVSFCDSVLDSIYENGGRYKSDSSEKHTLDSGIVVGSWISENSNENLSSDNNSDLLIVNSKTGHKIVFKESGELEINNGITTTISPNGIITTSATIINAPNSTINCKQLNATELVESPNISGTSSLKVGGTEMSGHVHGGVTRGDKNTNSV